MKKYFTFLLLTHFAFSFLFSQKVPEGYQNEPAVFRSGVYIPGTLDYDQLLKGDRVTNPWIVFADQEGINTTSRPGSGTTVQNLKFLDNFYVGDESGEYLHLVKDEAFNPATREFSVSAVSYGWVNRENVLLWRHCLITKPPGKLNRKAMILNTLETLKDDDSQFADLKANAADFYSDPNLQNKTGVKAGLFRIYFIYKESKNGFLLGVNSRISDPGYVKSDIIGWVSRKRVVPWDSRVALEPNAEISAAEERKNKGGKALVFDKEPPALDYKKGGQTSRSQVMWDADPFDKRPIGEWRRFPMLGEEGVNNGVAKIGLMGDINSEHGKMAAAQFAKVQQVVSTVKSDKRNIDVVFVVDATKSMGPFFAPIASAIKKSVASIEQRADKNSYRFGAVVYRDQAEGKRLIERTQLTDNGNRVASFLERIEAMDYHDRDAPEAVFYGLRESIKGLNLNKQHTNIIILVGDAGNHKRRDPSYVSLGDIQKLLVTYNCQLLVFQAQNKSSHATYNEFISDARQLITKVSLDAYSRTKATVKDQLKKAPILVKDSNDPYVWRLKDGAMAGSLRACPPGKALGADLLEKEVENVVNSTGRHVDQLIAILERMGSGESGEQAINSQNKENFNTPQSESPYVSAFGPAILSYLVDQGLTEEEVKTLTSESYQMFMTAYAPLERKGQNSSLFRPVLFMNLDELYSLLREMEAFLNSGTNEERRENIYNTWIELLRAHAGNLPKSEIESTSVEDLSQKVFGIPSTTEFLKGVKLGDLLDPKIVPDGQLNAYEQAISSKIRKLKSIVHKQNYPYAFESNGVSYYWIEQDLLP